MAKTRSDSRFNGSSVPQGPRRRPVKVRSVTVPNPRRARLAAGPAQAASLILRLDLRPEA